MSTSLEIANGLAIELKNKLDIDVEVSTGTIYEYGLGNNKLTIQLGSAPASLIKNPHTKTSYHICNDRFTVTVYEDRFHLVVKQPGVAGTMVSHMIGSSKVGDTEVQFMASKYDESYDFDIADPASVTDLVSTIEEAMRD